jgi:hypothetical protein
MKLLLNLFFIFLVTVSNAQDKLEVIEMQKTMSKGSQPGFMVKIPNAKLKTVISDWKKYLRQDNKTKINENDGEFSLMNTNVATISADTINIYSLVNANQTDVDLVGFINRKDSAFESTSNNPEISSNFSKYIRNFAVYEYRNIVTDELEVEQKKLETLNTGLLQLDKNNEQAEKKIKANEKENEKKQDEIKNNLQLKELKSDAIYEQQKVLAPLTSSSDLKKDEEKKLKALEKDKSKIEKKIDTLHSEIDANDKENKDLKKKIEDTTTDLIPAKKKEIEKQKEVISAVDTKLKGIK